MTDHVEDDPLVAATPLQERHAITLAVVSIFSASLSITGSGLIIYLARKRARKELYHRLMSFLSATDIILSTSVILQAFSLPVEDAPDAVWAVGNHATCTAAGFLFMYGSVTIAYYNAVLSVYFYLLVVYNFRDQSLVWRFEIPAHVLGVLLTLITPIAGVILDTYGVAPGLITACVYAAYPRGCLTSEDVECTGGLESVPMDYISLVVTGISVFIGFSATVMLYWRVRGQLRRNLRYAKAFTKISSNTLKVPQSDGNDGTLQGTEGRDVLKRSISFRSSRKANRQQAQLHNRGHISERLRSVRVRSLLYSAIYCNLFVWVIVATLVSSLKPSLFPLQFVIYLLFPLQGALNAIVYIRPRYIHWRAEFPDYSCGTILFKHILRDNTVEKEKQHLKTRQLVQEQLDRQHNDITSSSQTPQETDEENQVDDYLPADFEASFR